MTISLLRYSAAVQDVVVDRPVGVVIGGEGLDDEDMVALARAVGCPVTAFVLNPPSRLGRDGLKVRYFGGSCEIAFDAPATVAVAAALATYGFDGHLELATGMGLVDSRTVPRSGRHVITLTVPGTTPVEVSGGATRLPAAYDRVAA